MGNIMARPTDMTRKQLMASGYCPGPAVCWNDTWYLIYRNSDGDCLSKEVASEGIARTLGARDYIHMCNGVDTVSDRIAGGTNAVNA